MSSTTQPTVRKKGSPKKATQVPGSKPPVKTEFKTTLRLKLADKAKIAEIKEEWGITTDAGAILFAVHKIVMIERQRASLQGTATSRGNELHQLRTASNNFFYALEKLKDTAKG